MTNVWTIKAIEIKTSRLFALAFANSTTIPTEMPSKEEKSEIEINPVTAEVKIRKSLM